MESKQLILTAVKGTISKAIFGPALPGIIGSKKKELLASGNWKGWRLVPRTIAGFKNVPLLIKKPI